MNYNCVVINNTSIVRLYRPKSISVKLCRNNYSLHLVPKSMISMALVGLK